MRQNHIGTIIARGLAAGAIVTALGAASAHAGSNIRASLTATPAAPLARGQAKLQLKSATRGKFQLLAQRLAPNTTYEVVVNGVKVGTMTTSGGGSGKIRFSSTPKGHDLLLGFDPRGASIDVREADGDDVLEVASFPTTSPSDDDDDDFNKVACCLPDDSGNECEDRTPEMCAAEGGTLAGVNSCLPDPCAGVIPPGGEDEVLCCIPEAGDDSPSVECEDVTSAACAAAGGTVLTGATCDPNPCQPVPPTDLVACCVADDSGPECELRTVARCAERGGTAVDGGSCTPNPCAGVVDGGAADDNGSGGNGADDPAGDDNGGGNGGGSGGSGSGGGADDAPGDDHGAL